MSNRPDYPRITIVTPVYNEEKALPIYHQTVRDVLLSRTDCDFEVILVEDGSVDGSWEAIQEICRKDGRFRGIRLSRNFGSHVALSAGLQHANGDAVATLACDLQDPPSAIVNFVERWREGSQIVWGRRCKREDEFWRVLGSNLFYQVCRRAMPRGTKFTTGSFFLIDRKVVECFRQFREQNRITSALVAWTGFEQAVVDYERTRRLHGRTRWTLGRMLKCTFDAFISFSAAPAYLMSLLGMGVSGMAVLMAMYTVYRRIVGHPMPGWTSMMLVLFFFFGLQFLLMGLMGEYLYRIFTESVARPLYFVSETTERAEEQGREAA